MELCSKQKSVKLKFVLYFRFLKVATVYLDDSSAHSSHSHTTSSMRLSPGCFSTVLKESLYIVCWALIGCFSFTLRYITHPKPSQLGLVQVIVEARPSDAELQHSPSWSNSLYRAWRCVFGCCPVEKQMMVPLSTNQMGWHVSAECCGSHVG